MSGRLVLLRHGQSLSNVERRLDTRPPGTGLTPLGRDQARTFAWRGAQSGALRPSLLVHSVATRAAETATEIGNVFNMPAHELPGLHEVQVGELEDRSDDDAIAGFHAIYQRWHSGELDLPLPGGETASQVLDRYVPVLTGLRLRYLDKDDWTSDIVVVSHGAAMRLVAAVLAGVDGNFVIDNHIGNAEPVVLAPVTDRRWSCVRWGQHSPPFYPECDVRPISDALESDTDPMG